MTEAETKAREILRGHYQGLSQPPLGLVQDTAQALRAEREAGRREGYTRGIEDAEDVCDKYGDPEIRNAISALLQPKEHSE